MTPDVTDWMVYAPELATRTERPHYDYDAVEAFGKYENGVFYHG